MRLWQILMSVHTQNGAYRSTISFPTFYVWACDHSQAVGIAKQIVLANAKAVPTSGTAIAVDAKLNPVVETYYSWCEV